MVLQRGDRVLVRTYSPVVTVGGGVVAEVGVHHRRREPNLLARLDQQLAGDPLALLAERLAAREAPLPLDQAARQLDAPAEDLQRAFAGRADITLIAERWVWSPAAARRVADRVREVVTAYHREHPLRAGWPRERQKQEFPEWDARLFGQWVAALDGLELEGDVLRRTGFQVELTEAPAAWRAEIGDAVRRRGLEPPDLAWVLALVSAPEDTVRDVVQWMVAQGELVRLGDQLLVDGGVYADAVQAVAAAIAREGPLGTAALRDVLGTTRKYAVPLLERMDEARVTRREGDVRVLVQS